MLVSSLVSQSHESGPYVSHSSTIIFFYRIVPTAVLLGIILLNQGLYLCVYLSFYYDRDFRNKNENENK
jgi:hypothetical protein